MKELDYGKGYRYAHDEEGRVADMDCLPDSLKGPQLLPAHAGGPRKAAGAAHGRDSRLEETLRRIVREEMRTAS
jgi:putative ATPase